MTFNEIFAEETFFYLLLTLLNHYIGTTTLSITTLSITTLSIKVHMWH
jgi:hypothetical protein